MPAMASLAEYAAQVGPALGLTAQQAEGRLRCLMMMMDLAAMDTTEPVSYTHLFDVLESDGKDRFIPVQAIRFRMA